MSEFNLNQDQITKREWLYIKNLFEVKKRYAAEEFMFFKTVAKDENVAEGKMIEKAFINFEYRPFFENEEAPKINYKQAKYIKILLASEGQKQINMMKILSDEGLENSEEYKLIEKMFDFIDNLAYKVETLSFGL